MGLGAAIHGTASEELEVSDVSRGFQASEPIGSQSLASPLETNEVGQRRIAAQLKLASDLEPDPHAAMPVAASLALVLVPAKVVFVSPSPVIGVDDDSETGRIFILLVDMPTIALIVADHGSRCVARGQCQRTRTEKGCESSRCQGFLHGTTPIR
jgi:hypothetical protein